MKVSIALMGVPARMSFIREELALLPEGVKVFLDTERIGLWRNSRRAWLSYDPSADYHIVLQDDLYICNNFYAGVVAALSELPAGSFASFFVTGSKRGHLSKARDQGARWAKITGGFYGQAPCMAVSEIPSVFKWISSHIKEELDLDDLKYAMFSSFFGKPVWCSAPSLVQHREHVKSELGHKSFGVLSEYFVEDQDPTRIDWRVTGKEPVFNYSWKHFLRTYKDYVK